MGTEIAFLPAKQKQEAADIPSCVCSHQPSRPATLEYLHSLVVKSALSYCCQEPAHHCQAAKRVDVIVTLCVQCQLIWTLSVLNIPLDPSLNSSL